MPKVNDFVNQQHVFLQSTPLQIAGAGDVLPYGPPGARKITSKDLNGNPPADDDTPLLTETNYNSQVLLQDPRLYLTTRSYPGNSRDPNNTWVYFDIEDSVAPYGETCGGVRMRAAPGVGVGAMNRRCYYLPYYRNKISAITLGTGADYFFTDNLSGCAVYIDNTTYPATPIVCHANAMKISNHPDQTRPQTFMRRMHGRLNLSMDLALEKATYWAPGTRGGLTSAINSRWWNPKYGLRKVDATQSDTIAAFVVGFRDTGANTWTFYYQTLAMLKIDEWLISSSWYGGTPNLYEMVVSHSGQIV